MSSSRIKTQFNEHYYENLVARRRSLAERIKVHLIQYITSCMGDCCRPGASASSNLCRSLA